MSCVVNTLSGTIKEVINSELFIVKVKTIYGVGSLITNARYWKLLNDE